jgi:pyrroline-5-carboxylate reductase
VTQRILLVGAGRMGGALLKGWLASGLSPEVIEPNPSPELRKLTGPHRIAIHDIVHQASPRPRACVIALKPQVLKTEAAIFRSIAQSGALMISIAAGTTIRTMRQAWGREVRIVRAMPNIPGSIGHGISALYAPRNITRADRKLAQSLLAPLGETLWVPRESQIDSVTAVSGSGPAYIFLFVEALEQAAVAEGLSPVNAKRLARATAAGAGAMLDAGDREPADLRRDVTSPGGTTEAALEILMAKDGLTLLIARAVRAARQRAEDIGG